MAEHGDGLSEAASEQGGVSGGAKFARWFWILFLSFIAFWPIRGWISGMNDADRWRHGYGRRWDLDQIGRAIEAYASNYNDQLPPTLLTLYPNYIPRARALVSPGDIDPQESGGVLNRYIYFYEGGGPMPQSGPLVLYPFKADSGEVRCTVLFADGRVEYAKFFDALADRQEGDSR